jgi:amidase
VKGLKLKENVKKTPEDASRRSFLRASAIGVMAAVGPINAAGTSSSASIQQSDVPAFELDEITVDEPQRGMVSGKFTSRSIAEKYLARIEAIDGNGPTLRAVIETNPDALAIADRPG